MDNDVEIKQIDGTNTSIEDFMYKMFSWMVDTGQYHAPIVIPIGKGKMLKFTITYDGHEDTN